MNSVFVFTGAFDCGKTTTLGRLSRDHGYRSHREAHVVALESLGNRTAGHPPDRPFRRIDDTRHVCPLCRPVEFTRLVLDIQRSTEREAADGDLLERGYVDPIEYYERQTSRASPFDWTPIARYRLVFLLDVMPRLQRPRWGRSRRERIELAERINGRLAERYEAAGFTVLRVAPGTVARRAEWIHDRIQNCLAD